jgi:hypothetical protein
MNISSHIVVSLNEEIDRNREKERQKDREESELVLCGRVHARRQNDELTVRDPSDTILCAR